MTLLAKLWTIVLFLPLLFSSAPSPVYRAPPTQPLHLVPPSGYSCDLTGVTPRQKPGSVTVYWNARCSTYTSQLVFKTYPTGASELAFISGQDGPGTLSVDNGLLYLTVLSSGSTQDAWRFNVPWGTAP